MDKPEAPTHTLVVLWKSQGHVVMVQEAELTHRPSAFRIFHQVSGTLKALVSNLYRQ